MLYLIFFTVDLLYFEAERQSEHFTLLQLHPAEGAVAVAHIMRLLETSWTEYWWQKPSLREFVGDNIPPYAILSHTWGQDEVLFRDVEIGTAHRRESFYKVKSAAAQAARDGFAYVWIDTCCIDKSSSAELQEAINSMFA